MGNEAWYPRSVSPESAIRSFRLPSPYSKVEGVLSGAPPQ